MPTRQNITLQGHHFNPLLTEPEILESIQTVAQRIDRDFEGKRPLFLVVLKGAYLFAAELTKQMELDVELEFIRAKSYEGTQTTGIINCSMGPLKVEGREVVIVEDIVDTGHTVEYLEAELLKMGAKNVKIATMFLKPEKYQKERTIDYVGREIPSEFVVGFGLDVDEYGRGLKELYIKA